MRSRIAPAVGPSFLSALLCATLAGCGGDEGGVADAGINPAGGV